MPPRRRPHARAGPTLHSFALEWVDHYAGRGANDVINDRTRREHRRLLITYALACFPPEEPLREIDEHRARAFVDWLCRLTDEDGHRLCDRSVRIAVVPLQSCLRHAAQAGLLGVDAEPAIMLPRRRRGRAYEFADLEMDQPRIRVRRAIVNGQLSAPKSRHGRRTVPISSGLARQLAALADRGETELLFVGAQGATLRPGNLRYRVMIPAAPAPAYRGRAFTLRHTCAALLIEAGAGSLRLQRWMGHHSAAFTLDNYGHLIDGELGSSLDLGEQLLVVGPAGR